MKIGLIDIDGHNFPNLALMKISAFHKMHDDVVDWFNPLFDNPDKIYASKIFDFTKDYEYFPGCEVVKGGTGYDLSKRLDDDTEKMSPDYNIYPKYRGSLQLFSRGCVRSCPFCVVRKKEGFLRPVKPMNYNPLGEYIEVLDNNFFANPEWRSACENLLLQNQPVNFHGIDIRLITDEQLFVLNKFKLHKSIKIAWDNPDYDAIPALMKMLKIIKPYKLMCYVLIGFDSTPEQDLYRTEELRKLNVNPFVMPFDKSDDYQKRFARYVNHKAIWKSIKWEEYKG